MRYLIVQDWDNTHGNHAGMVHMCRLLCEKAPNDYKMIVKDCPPPIKQRTNPFIRKLMGWYDRRTYKKEFVQDYMNICRDMFSSLKTGDEVFLLEYNWPPTTQYELACYIKEHYADVKIYALSHLTPTYFEQQRNVRERILTWDKPIDKHLTLGSSLSTYFQKIGIRPEKISTGFHYVDVDYYNNEVEKVATPITVISIGALQRDFSLLANIVKGCERVNWIICRGRKNIDDKFEGLRNVRLVGYVEENELKSLMGQADLSLNVLEDTVGSNVITTSMAMGLGIVVSDVGSIHDYCDERNTVFCENTADSFVKQINYLSENPKKVLEMKKQSLKKSSTFVINKVNDWFNAL